MSVEISYRTKVRSRLSRQGDRETSEVALAYLLVLDGNYDLVNIEQVPTHRWSKEPNEFPEALIEIVTDLGGYWEDDEVQGLWERWLVYREVPTDAAESVRWLFENRVATKYTTARLAPGSRVTLTLDPPEVGEERVFLMELEIVDIEYTDLTGV